MDEKIEQLLLLIESLGWDCAFEYSKDHETLKGMIIGEKDYLNLIISHLPSDNPEMDERLN